VKSNELAGDEYRFELAAESITVQIRWFGLAVGYVLVNFIGRDTAQPAVKFGESVLTNQQVLNGILTLGAIYALIDTLWRLRGKVFLSQWPLFISLMEAVFIGLLCYFDYGLESPFRLYYFLSLLVCAIRYMPWITYSTFALHAVSFGTLAFSGRIEQPNHLSTLLLMLVIMGWVTWASTALAGLVKAASRGLLRLNDQLQQNQELLEQRIDKRTRELQQSQALLLQQEKQAAFGLLAAGIAHEVGNPLAAISSLVQLLNRRDYDEYTRDRLQMVDDQLRRIQRTLRELVDFGRPTSTAESLCDVHTVILASLNIAKYYKRKKGKRIVTRFSEGFPKLRIVRDQLVQVFLNLILNAMDATDEGGTIEIATFLETGWIHVLIRDNGHGIAKEHQEMIFRPYFTTKETGTGLGLFVCKNIAEQMDGVRVQLVRSTSQGTTFAVLLTCENVKAHPDVSHTTLVSSEEIQAS